MKTTLLQLLAATMCLAMVFTMGVNDLAYAQETPSGDPEEDNEVSEGEEDAAVAAARRRYGPNKATAKIGENEIFILAGRPDIEKDPGYAAIGSTKTGSIVQMTLGQAVKLSTPFNLKFGSLVVKKENVAPNYPGVYSVWIKKTSSGWNFVFNEKPDIWGTMHNSKSDVGEASAKYTALDEPVKGLKLGMEAEDGNGTMSITWGKHKWSAPFSIEQ